MDDKIIYLEYLHESGLKFCVFSCYGQMVVKNFIFTYFHIYDCGILYNSRYIFRNSERNDRNSKANASTLRGAIGDET